jgi:hypothetical protein
MNVVPQIVSPDALRQRLSDFLRKLGNGKGAPEWRRREARELLHAIEDGVDSPHYVQPREGWEPGIAFEGQDKPRGNIEPEEGALKTSR